MDTPRSEIEYSEFITSLLAHDISNYNQTSRGYLEMLLEEYMGVLSEEHARVLTICLRQSNRIQSLLESVRLLSDVATAPVEPMVIDLDEPIREAIRFVEKDFADREIRVRFTPADRRTRAEDHLGTVFRHLLSNAVRHNDAEVAEIDVAISETQEPGFGRVLISDNGDGVPPARCQDLFSRLDNRDIHGSGLGLSVVRRLVERWGGRVWLEPSEAGQGATFGLTLPLP
jgi:signal transduction histidine kinase